MKTVFSKLDGNFANAQLKLFNFTLSNFNFNTQKVKTFPTFVNREEIKKEKDQTTAETSTKISVEKNIARKMKHFVNIVSD